MGNKESGADATSMWMTDGTPPRLNDGAKDLFNRLTSLHSERAMTSLASLLHVLMSRTSPDVDVIGYDLSFLSLLAQCSRLSSTKAAHEFYVAMLYIRLAIHIDQ